MVCRPGCARHMLTGSAAADAQVSEPYHVRVLIPCYREPLAIIVKTINASYDALLPAGCHRTIYVCDDGLDPKLRRFCRAMGPSVVYVSGRRRQVRAPVSRSACTLVQCQVVRASSFSAGRVKLRGGVVFVCCCSGHAFSCVLDLWS